MYCEPVPPAASLPAVPGKSIVKPLPFEPLENTEGGAASDDPFVRIVPVAIQNILDGYAAAARARIEALNGRLEHVSVSAGGRGQLVGVRISKMGTRQLHGRASGR